MADLAPTKTDLVVTAPANAPALSVVVPAFNEAARIGDALVSALAYLRGQEATRSFELIVADDGSSDDTLATVERVAAQYPAGLLRAVRLPRNRGKGAALRAGVGQSRGHRVLVMDADLATPIDELESLWRTLDDGAQLAIASRALATSDITRSQAWWRVMLGRAGNLWIRAIAVRGVADTQCGFKLFDGPLARELFRLSRQDGFEIDIELLCLAQRHFGLTVREVGVRWAHHAGSKVRWRHYLDVLVRVPRIAWSVARLDPAPAPLDDGAGSFPTRPPGP